MIEHECPACGESLRSPKVCFGEAVHCPRCGELVVVPKPPTRAEEEEPVANVYMDTAHKPGSVGRFFRAVSLGLGIFIAIFGAIGIHIWITYLFYHNWGEFSAFLAFFIPPLGEIAALVFCFGWGVWFYVLAAAAWIVACYCASGAEDERRAPAVSVAALLLFVGLCASFGYFAYDHATAPTRITGELRQELDDVTFAVCATLMGSASDDPLTATDVAKAKAKLRTRLREYDETSRAYVRRSVDAYLRCLHLVFDDMETYLAADDVDASFAFSEKTSKAWDDAPLRIRAEMGASQVAGMEKRVTSLRKLKDSDPETNKSSELRAAFDQQWAVYGYAYKDLFGVPMPTRDQLLSEE